MKILIIYLLNRAARRRLFFFANQILCCFNIILSATCAIHRGGSFSNLDF